jgi:sugar phosphate isomerase/epimerase
MLLGYNTNGFAYHTIEDALAILHRIGYGSVAITLDYYTLNPRRRDTKDQLRSVRRLLSRYELHSVIETGARFLLDPWRKHQPTLVSPSFNERLARLQFLKQAVDVAHALGSDAVSFWSGTPVDQAPRSIHMQCLIEACRTLADYADRQGVLLAFEPEPGMFIDTMARCRELLECLQTPGIGVTIDIGHLHCQSELPITGQLLAWQNRIANIHIEDMRKGVHEHLMFGEGEIEFGPIVETLRDIRYRGGVHVELSRHSHDAVHAAETAFAYLSQLDGALPIISTAPLK